MAASRADARLALLAALLAVAALSAAADPQPMEYDRKPAIKGGVTPKTFVASFKNLTMEFLQELNTKPLRVAFRLFAEAVNLPKINYTQADMLMFRRNLRRILDLNSVDGPTHVAGINQFTFEDPANLTRFLGLAPKGNSTRAQVRARIAELMVRTSSLSAAEVTDSAARVTAAARAYAVASGEAASASRRAAGAGAVPAQGGGRERSFTDWSSTLPTAKNQGTCGSCWAHTGAAMTESASYIKTGHVTSLSEQQLVDCDNKNNLGCLYGLAENAFVYIKSKGITTSSDYPYLGAQRQCETDLAAKPSSKLLDFKHIEPATEEEMLLALARGPISVEITADWTFMSYSGGIYQSGSCTGETNHAVTIVGAGFDDATQLPFWIIRNSAGPEWGENGYMRMVRGVNMCNVASNPWQVESADKGTAAAPVNIGGSTASCSPSYVDVTPRTPLVDIAKRFQTTLSQIMLDNGLDYLFPIAENQRLLITCPRGKTTTWSEPYGVDPKAVLAAVPAVNRCPPGEFAVEFAVKNSVWNTDGFPKDQKHIGRITMTCSGGLKLTVDAMPNYNDTDFGSGTTGRKPTGFTQVDVRTSMAVDNLFGLSKTTTGDLVIFKCPAGTKIVGYAAGVYAPLYPTSDIANLQFQCADPADPTLADDEIFGDCKTKTVTVDETTSLVDLAEQYKTTSAALMIDNGLTWTEPLRKGQQLVVKCTDGTWSPHYGVENKTINGVVRRWNENNGMVEVPVVKTCPAGEYVVQIYVRLSEYFSLSFVSDEIIVDKGWANGTSVGTVVLTCSNGHSLTVDGQPNHIPNNGQGKVKQPAGFKDITMRITDMVNNILGYGQEAGSVVKFACPDGQLLTGVAGGAWAEAYPYSALSNLQWQCRAPFVDGKSVADNAKSSFPSVSTGVSCATYTAAAKDTWVTIAKKYSTTTNELIRANPDLKSLKAGAQVFLPPCINGRTPPKGKKGRRSARAPAVGGARSGDSAAALDAEAPSRSRRDPQAPNAAPPPAPARSAVAAADRSAHGTCSDAMRAVLVTLVVLIAACGAAAAPAPAPAKVDPKKAVAPKAPAQAPKAAAAVPAKPAAPAPKPGAAAVPKPRSAAAAGAPADYEDYGPSTGARNVGSTGGKRSSRAGGSRGLRRMLFAF
ncbi:Vignain [Scenedesmus sp. PABB004]|nr:Vignain [Scenedesmus sp. PABB004]